jgi:hypothetical protein
MFYTIFYNILGVLCLLALVGLIKKLLVTFKTPVAPVSLKAKVLSLLLGILMGFAATWGTIYAGIAVFFMLGMPRLSEYTMTVTLYLVTCFSFVLSYGLSKITGIIYRQGLPKLVIYSALIVSVYFALQPIGYHWLRFWVSIMPVLQVLLFRYTP